MNPEKKLILIIAIILIMIGIMVLVFIQPFFYEIKNLTEKIEKEREEIEILYQKGKTLAQAKNELEEIEKNKALLEGVFLETGEELSFITSLEKIANKNNVFQEVVLEERGPFQNNFETLPISLSLKGNFDNFVKYFDELEKLDFYFNVNYLNIFALTSQDSQLGASLGAKTYWRKK